MKRRKFLAFGAVAVLARAFEPLLASARSASFNVRDFGATGNGSTLDTDSINRAIAAAAEAGGGFVDVPAGRYLAYTIHLRSHITLRFAPGGVFIAATPDFDLPGHNYDLPEPQPESFRPYQDYGHNHWHNSLLWGENIENVAIEGPGELWGRGLQKGDGPLEEQPGAGNKCIALKRCRNITLRDISLRDAGHFGVLASGVDGLTIENVRIDTRRDGIDIDACRDVHIRGCTVNAPWDDAIVLKSSFSLGESRPTERVTISDCIVTGRYQAGTLLDGTYLAFPPKVPADQPSFVGRIKIGTETNGDIRNIAVTNCVLEGCHGLAVESEDGGNVQDVTFSNIVMRDMQGPPIFVRLGGRLRGPAGTVPGTIQRIGFHQIDCGGSTGSASSIIAGIPDHPVQDLSITEVRIHDAGGGKIRSSALPEHVTEYPDPEMFGATPSQGFYIRHVEQIELRDIHFSPVQPDPRPLIWLDDVRDATVVEVTSSGSGTELLRSINSTLDPTQQKR
jgi:polygalacturonase